MESITYGVPVEIPPKNVRTVSAKCETHHSLIREYVMPWTDDVNEAPNPGRLPAAHALSLLLEPAGEQFLLLQSMLASEIRVVTDEATNIQQRVLSIDEPRGAKGFHVSHAHAGNRPRR